MYKKILIYSSIILVAGALTTMMFWNKKTDEQKNTHSSKDNSAYSTRAYFAGGCFWCVEKDFEKLEGVGDVISGYSGGKQANPTYADHADHREAVMVPYDPEVISYAELVHYFFRHHDGTDEGGSFYDRGHSYTSAISYQNEEERIIAEDIKNQLDMSGIFEKALVTSIEAFIDFTVAEDYHQNYYKRDAVSATKYRYYRAASGRDLFIESVKEREDALGLSEGLHLELKGKKTAWSSYTKPADEVLRESLSEIAYKVTQKDATERPFSEGNHDDEKREGIFVDILSGEPLFSSADKFDSGTGWPSFTKPIGEEFITTKIDYKLIYPRTEVRSRYADNHLGHVFNDGPSEHNGKPSSGKRWCINGAALRFVSLEDMESEGYADYIDRVK